jgi:hypothetical protein
MTASAAQKKSEQCNVQALSAFGLLLHPEFLTNAAWNTEPDI